MLQMGHQVWEMLPFSGTGCEEQREIEPRLPEGSKNRTSVADPMTPEILAKPI